MHRILLTTMHPAPYIDRWMFTLGNEFNTTVIYNRFKSREKLWKEYQGYPGEYFPKLSIWKLIQLIKKNELIIVGGWTNFYCLETIIFSILLHKKVAIFTDYPFHQNKYADVFKKYILYRSIDYIFGATQSTCEFIRNKYGKTTINKTKLFPYIFEKSSVSTCNFKDDNKDHMNIYIANNFIDRKGYSILFEALKIVSQSPLKNKYEITISGSGILLEHYKKVASKMNLNIKFCGWIETKDYNEIMEKTDIYIHPSLEEPFGIPPLDAMYKQKVVIVSDGVKSTDKIIRNGINGYIYPRQNAQILADIILSLDCKTFENIGINAYNDVNSYYSVKINTETIKSCLV